MRYRIKIAWRYLTSNPAQSWLLIVGVALGVFVFVFMSALIGGLAVLLTERTVGNVAHVTLVVPDLKPKVLYDPGTGALIAAQSSSSRAQLVRNAGALARVIDDFEGVAAISPEIVGNGFATRGAQIKPVSIVGVEPGSVSAIADIAGHLVGGNAFLPSGTVLIGKKLADSLGLAAGQQLRLRSDQGVNASLTIAGVYSFGFDALDERTVYVNLKSARGLLGVPQGVNRIELKLDDLWAAPEFAALLGPATGLEATPWTATNAQLLSGLDAQARSGTIIKSFALVTIVIGVASALLLSTYRRRSEIGIMRAMGASRGFVVMVFVAQGGLIG
ncbi:MAG: ABC transporter permease, partial [Alphaproteobacteria bacterium]